MVVSLLKLKLWVSIENLVLELLLDARDGNRRAAHRVLEAVHPSLKHFLCA